MDVTAIACDTPPLQHHRDFAEARSAHSQTQKEKQLVQLVRTISTNMRRLLEDNGLDDVVVGRCDYVYGGCFKARYMMTPTMDLQDCMDD